MNIEDILKNNTNLSSNLDKKRFVDDTKRLYQLAQTSFFPKTIQEMEQYVSFRDYYLERYGLNLEGMYFNLFTYGLHEKNKN